MRVFVVSQATLERYNKFTRNCSCCCETAEAVETTAKSELSRSNKDSLATWMLVSSTSMTVPEGEKTLGRHNAKQRVRGTEQATANFPQPAVQAFARC